MQDATPFLGSATRPTGPAAGVFVPDAQGSIRPALVGFMFASTSLNAGFVGRDDEFICRLKPCLPTRAYKSARLDTEQEVFFARLTRACQLALLSRSDAGRSNSSMSGPQWNTHIDISEKPMILATRKPSDSR